jgi:hypothetical protein
MKRQTAVTAPAFEASPIKLSVDETRLVIKATVAGKPIDGSFQCNALAELGIFRRIEIPEEKDTARKVAECWARARKALVAKDGQGLHQSMHDLERLNSDRHREDTRYRFEGYSDLSVLR